jgi:hypothetical protein
VLAQYGFAQTQNRGQPPDGSPRLTMYKNTAIVYKYASGTFVTFLPEPRASWRRAYRNFLEKNQQFCCERKGTSL